MRECVMCGVSFDPNGTTAICCSVECSKERHNERSRRYREQNPEKVKEIKRKWSEKNPEKQNERSRRYRERNLEKVKEYNRKRHEKNPEKQNERSRRYREQNPEKIKEIKRKWSEKNPEKTTERCVRHYLRYGKGIANPPEPLVKLATEIRLTKRLVKELTSPTE